MTTPGSPSLAGMRRLLVALTLLANAFVFALVGYSLYESWLAQESRAATQTQNLATTLVRNLGERLRSIDLALLGAKEEFERQMKQGGIDAAEMSRFLARHQARLPELDGLRMTDAEGIIRYGEGLEHLGAVSLADRDYVTFQRDTPEGGRFLGKPVPSRVTGKLITALSYRLNGPDGRFAGVVYATLRVDELTRIFSELDLGNRGSIILRDADLGLIARYPAVAGPAGEAGNARTSAEFQDLVREGRTAATYVSANPSDGVERLYSFQRLPNAPWYVIAGLAREDYMAEWRNQAGRYLGFALLFLVVSVLAARMVWRGWKSQLAIARKLAETHDDLRLAATAFETQEAIAITDAGTRIIRVNKAFTQVTGYTPEEIIGKTPAALRSGRHDAAFYRDLWRALNEEGCWQGEIWNRRKDGEIFPEWLTITAVRDDAGAVCNYVAAFVDISHRKQAEKQIQHLAFYDPLTGLPNRSLLLERIGQAITATARQENHGALLFIDLDNFKTLNDTLGHDMGDRLLVLVAERLKGCVRESDTVARLGGDEFVVMLEGLSPQAMEAATEAEMICEKILRALDRTDEFNRVEHHNTASIGVTLLHGHDSNIDDLLKRGDLAMYGAKAAGGNGFRFFDPAMQSVVENRARLETELRHALKDGQFRLYFQPQYDEAGRTIGAEALLRWQHPERGVVPPAEFIPLAESSGLILPIGEWVLHAACRQLAEWQKDAATAHLRLAVNVSARQFRQADFADQVRAALAGSGAQAHGLKLEITESLLVEDVDEAIRKMECVRDMGVGFALDDFGTGYSSLSYLKRLPLEQLKIDRSFVSDMLDNSKDEAIIRTVLALGKSLGIAVVAEGVETEAQSDFLEHLGCKAFQGYYFGRPAPVEALELGNGEPARVG